MGELLTMDKRVWLADLTHTGRGVATDTVPLGIGMIAAYTQTQCALPEPIRLFRYPERLAEALDRFGPPDVIGFASYVWNADLSRGFARAIKRRSPGTTVVFGGPDFPLAEQDKLACLLAAPEIDFFVEREGEFAFVSLLRCLDVVDWRVDEVHGDAFSVCSVDTDGKLRRGPLAQRIRDLSVVPSPYLNASMDEFLDGRLVPTLQTNRGCPFTCSFCLEGDRYYSRVSFFPPDRIAAELRYIAERMVDVVRQGGRNELMITDSNFAMYHQDAEVCRAIGLMSQQYGWPAHVNVTTGKNRRDRVLASIRQANGTIELSGAVQSLDQSVLENINRATISTEDLLAVAQEASASATQTYSDVILGLPGDTVESHVETVTTLIDSGFGRVNTFQFALLRGAEVNSAEVRRRFTLRTQFRVLPRDFGRYRVLGEDIICAEIDEVCVGSDTLSFDEYLQCRLFDLTTFLFHNDRMLATTEAAIRKIGASVGDWIRALHRLERWSGRLDLLRANFLADTRTQLFGSAEKAKEDVAQRISSYLSGDLGNNLLYSYRARTLTEAVDDLTRTALLGMAPLLRAADPLDWELLRQALEFDRLRLSNVFDTTTGQPPQTLESSFDFDMSRLLASSPSSVQRLRLQRPRRVRFELSESIQRLLTAYRRTMGPTADGLGRALTRVPIEDFKRIPVHPGA